jgi:hypothetical protein
LDGHETLTVEKFHDRESDDLYRKRDDSLSRVEAVCRLRMQEAKGNVEITSMRGSDLPLEYLRVTESSGGIPCVYPVSVCEGNNISIDVLGSFVARIVDKYRATDRGCIPQLVYGGDRPADDPVWREAARHRVRLFSFPEYQKLIDFRSYLEKQTKRLVADPLYPPGLYVPQRIRFEIGRKQHEEESAINVVRGWLGRLHPGWPLQA